MRPRRHAAPSRDESGESLFGSEKHRNEREAKALEHGKELHEAGEYEELVKYYESLPPADVTPRIVADLARAYANLAVERRAQTDEFDLRSKDLLDYAISLMESVVGYFGEDDPQVNYFIGKSYLMLDLPSKALPYVRRYKQAKPDDGEASQLLAYCETSLAAPFSITPFVKRAKAAWEKFSKNEAEIRSLLDWRRDNEAYYLAEDSLFDGAEFMLAQLPMQGRCQLILSPLHWRPDLYKLVLFKSMAPASVLEHWEILLGWQVCDNADFDTGNRIVYAEDVVCWPEYYEDDGTVFLKVYSKPLAKERERDSELAYKAATSLVDETVGEIVSMQCVDGLEVLPSPLDSKSMTLFELREAIAEKLAPIHEGRLGSEEACLAQEFCFSKAPTGNKSAQMGDRSDAVIGSSTCPELIDDYNDGYTDSVDVALEDGVVEGYFYWPHGQLAETDIAEGLVFELSEDVEDAIAARAPEGVVSFIGASYGTQCSYLDFIAWDFPVLMQTARDVFADFPIIDCAAFRAFRPGAPSFAVKGSYK